MSGPGIDLAPPPADVSGFPTQPARRAAHTLFRIFFHRHAATGALNPPWRFSAAPPGAARFDLPVPRGTCYWSDRRYGAFVEVFRGASRVDHRDLVRRRLFVAHPPGLSLADATAPGAYRFGVTAELSTVVPYTLPQLWAAALHGAGFEGLIAACRHDPTLVARTVAVFGPAGVTARRAGWRTSRHRVDADPVLNRELAELGIRIAPVPYVVPTIPAPS